MTDWYFVSESGESIAFAGDVTVGRGSDCQVRFEDDVTCSRRQFQLRVTGGEVRIEQLSQSTPTYINGAALSGADFLKSGDVVSFGRQRLVFRPSDVDARANSGGEQRTALLSGAAGQQFAEDNPTALTPRLFGGVPSADYKDEDSGGGVHIGEQLVVGRSDDAADLVLEHPAVSRRHAVLSIRDGLARIRDLGSTNGTFVNGAPIVRPHPLQDGDRIDIGPYSLRFDRGLLFPAPRTGAASLSAQAVTIDVKAAGTLRILDNVSFDIQPNEFVCIVGPSGSGKTTLMKALAGRSKPTFGSVQLNDFDLHANFEGVKQEIAMVPQHDVLHENLTLRRALTYTARLRLPVDTSAAALREAVEKAARDVELDQRLDTKIGKLSGGQKKRASLASEMISQPSLVFLDEVTSGLDEATDREIMRLLRRRADAGTTVVCVTHTLANVEEFCHRLIIMGEGGVLAFFGAPAQALEHFGVQRLGGIFDRLKERPASEWGAAFSPPNQRSPGGQPAGGSEGRAARAKPAQIVRQFAILTQRNLELLLADRRALTMAAVQSILIGSLIGYAFIDFGEQQAAIASKNALLLLLGLCAIWLGCNSASQDIVGELPIFRRENDVNLSAASFVSSKFVVSGAFTMIQLATVFGLAALIAEDMPGADGMQLGLLLIGALAGTAMGLLISSLADTNEQATTIVPLALVPQLILAGVLVPKLPEFATSIAEVGVSGFWLTEGMKHNLIEAEGPITVFDAAKGGNVIMEAKSAALAAVVIAIHSLAFLALAYAAVLLGTRKSR